MSQEIERKFLVDPARLGPLTHGVNMRQGFIETADLTVVRVRVAGEAAWLTLKGANTGAVRTEFEYPIPPADAEQILAEMCTDRIIVKTRYLKQVGGHTWEIDVFENDNAGLIVAEVEIESEKDQPQLPDWVTEEVTGDARYYNINLMLNPVTRWGEDS